MTCRCGPPARLAAGPQRACAACARREDGVGLRCNRQGTRRQKRRTDRRELRTVGRVTGGRQATRWKQTESQGENRRLLDGSGAARADLRHVRQARRVVQQDEARSAARSARARSALAAAQAAAGWWWTNVPSGGWWSERSERGICVGCRFRPERKGWRTRVSSAFEAVRLYNSYNLYNVVQLFEFVFVSGPRLFGSNSKKGTGT